MNDSLPVRAHIHHGPNVFELQLDRQGMSFVPGDCLALFTEDGRVSRPYSLASGINEDVLRVVIRKMSGGTVSTYLAERNIGDQVRVSPPFGWFRPGEHHEKRPFVFVATGTGIAPFLSHLRSRPGARPAACFYGIREKCDAVDLDWIRSVCDAQCAVSRENVPGCHHGHVTELVAALPPQPDTDFYLCGLDAMIDDVTNVLESRGVDITRIHRECFFNASYT